MIGTPHRHFTWRVVRWQTIMLAFLRPWPKTTGMDRPRIMKLRMLKHVPRTSPLAKARSPKTRNTAAMTKAQPRAQELVRFWSSRTSRC